VDATAHDNKSSNAKRSKTYASQSFGLKYKALYQPTAKTPVIVQVPDFLFVRVDGAIEKGFGPGNSPGFQQAVEAMYGFAYALKCASKQRAKNPIDFPVMALEGLWWVEDGNFDFNVQDNWLYTLQIMQPPHITPEMVEEARVKLKAKKENPALDRVRLEHFDEGLCVQMMHIGPYATEPATIEKMRAFAQAQGYQFHHKHHEIYLGDPRRANPEKLKTVLRHPLTK
jgi:hypothetical protein